MRFLIILFLFSDAWALDPKIDYSESYYTQVAATSEDCSTGVVIPNGQKIAVHTIRTDGVSSDVYTMVVFDRGGGSEKIFSSSTNHVDTKMDTTDVENQITGDGVKKLQVCIVNDKTVQSIVVGGAYECVKL